MSILKSSMARRSLALILLSLTGCASNRAVVSNPHPDSLAAFDYLKALEGTWVAHGMGEGPFGWEFEVTSKGTMVLERLKVGTPTAMTTVYHLENDALLGHHYCQLGNQPHLSAVNSKVDGDLHFLCDGRVSSTDSHDELHMHGVHFKKTGEGLKVWMDMYENGKVAFQTTYTLFRAE